MWKDVIMVGLGGAAGSILRFLISHFSAYFLSEKYLYWGTFFCNITGALLIGMIAGKIISSEATNQTVRLLLVVGFCGGYTTFSTFTFENMGLLRSGEWGSLLLYISASIILGIGATCIGFKITH